MLGSRPDDQAESVTVLTRRAPDRRLAFQARPFVVDLGSARYLLTPLDAQLLLGELDRLPVGRYPGAARTAEMMLNGLVVARATFLGEEEQRTVLRAVEGVRARRRLTAGLGALRQALVERLPSQIH
jgi:hypothetical protein